MAVPYSISKAAMNIMMGKFSASYKKEGILFMAVSPGAVDSDDDVRGSNAPVQHVEGDLSQTLYLVRPWHKFGMPTLQGFVPFGPSNRNPQTLTSGCVIAGSAPELQKCKEQGRKFNKYKPSYTKPLNTRESVDFVLKVLSEKSIESGDAGAFISQLGNKRWP
ncbi:uncharacterized protein Z519_00832 [Cladophialophora bantiana CBS 173.52]|uniref:Uncharacterized protein n=1 Tax=Cladophialophora bantiana (strain ATCC 10958 / CBS 173.52 / CDC B-1940 / NIH 8579) TaxID=1442370 RepID=A0A0D2IR09_CLAB1|nr:uncharacterized protein Z519_00832 [Cladophialophora bantiana CBS 173.52]KIW99169.1 hypothetical protein Z519_00832 [Cladophialophora bantiana CBS 173.52]